VKPAQRKEKKSAMGEKKTIGEEELTPVKEIKEISLEKVVLLGLGRGRGYGYFWEPVPVLVQMRYNGAKGRWRVQLPWPWPGLGGESCRYVANIHASAVDAPTTEGYCGVSWWSTRLSPLLLALQLLQLECARAEALTVAGAAALLEEHVEAFYWETAAYSQFSRLRPTKSVVEDQKSRQTLTQGSAELLPLLGYKQHWRLRKQRRRLRLGQEPFDYGADFYEILYAEVLNKAYSTPYRYVAGAVHRLGLVFWDKLDDWPLVDQPFYHFGGDMWLESRVGESGVMWYDRKEFIRCQELPIAGVLRKYNGPLVQPLLLDQIYAGVWDITYPDYKEEKNELWWCQRKWAPENKQINKR
jgi:hypothetical protein